MSILTLLRKSCESEGIQLEVFNHLPRHKDSTSADTTREEHVLWFLIMFGNAKTSSHVALSYMFGFNFVSV